MTLWEENKKGNESLRRWRDYGEVFERVEPKQSWRKSLFVWLTDFHSPALLFPHMPSFAGSYAGCCHSLFVFSVHFPFFSLSLFSFSSFFFFFFRLNFFFVVLVHFQFCRFSSFVSVHYALRFIQVTSLFLFVFSIPFSLLSYQNLLLYSYIFS